MNKKQSSRGRGRERRGVAVIVGGVILVAILLSTIFGLYFTLLSNDKARSSYEIQSQQESKEKGIETFIVDRDQTISGGSVNVNINNTGSIPMVASHALTYCSAGASCTNTGVPIHDLTVATVLNAGETKPVTVGNALMTSGNTYTISVISERGNIISSTTCTVQADDTCSEDSGGDGLGEEEVVGLINEGIVQGTGSLQLDFRAFGAVYPVSGSGLASRAGVNQEGWLVTTPSKYGNVTGYPAFDVPGDINVVYIERIRNLDPYGESIKLSASSGLVTNIGTIPPGHQAAEFICNATKTFSGGNPTGGSVSAYSYTTAYTFIPATAIDAPNDEGWQEVYFCTENAGSGTINFKPAPPDGDVVNGNLMMMRGTFSPSGTGYGQVIPYQSSVPGTTTVGNFEACLRTDATLNTNCPGHSTVCDTVACATTTHKLVYSASRAAITGAGVSVWVHVDTVTRPVTVSWIYHNGTIAPMTMTNGNPATDQTLNGFKYVPNAVRIPTDIDACDGSNPQYYTIMVSNTYSTAGIRDVYYMTFRVTCP